MEPWLEAFARTYFQRSADTAHDLKTPLNVAVLNLELLRMRIARLAEGDEKVAAYAAAIETELRRMAQVFDVFFLLTAPPKEDPEPAVMDVVPICRAVAEAADVGLDLTGRLRARVHESRMRQALKLFFDGASRLLRPEGREVSGDCANGTLQVIVRGRPAAADLELAKIFKFYYTDRLGDPDLSLATARLIIETYGGELNAIRERDKVAVRLSLPQVINEKGSDR